MAINNTQHTTAISRLLQMAASCSAKILGPESMLLLAVKALHHFSVLITCCASEMCFSALSCDLNTMATLPSLSKMKVCESSSQCLCTVHCMLQEHHRNRSRPTVCMCIF